MARVSVVDPYSGVTLDVEHDSPQALMWGTGVAPAVEGAPGEGSASAGSEKRKPGRPKKAE